MQPLPEDELRASYRLGDADDWIDQTTALRLKRRMAEEFREQLTFGAPTNEDEAGLRRLAAQLRSGKVVVKLFLRHTLHAKLYLLYRTDPDQSDRRLPRQQQPDLRRASQQGELNVDVLDHDAVRQARTAGSRIAGTTAGALDISDELVEIIEESWAREETLPPYHIYLKMAYHLSQEARAGLSEFRIPRDFGNSCSTFRRRPSRSPPTT